MRVWVDADACPGPVKDVVIKAATRRAVEAAFVANKPQTLPSSPYLSCVQVELSADAADRHILEHAVGGDLVVTADIPLAYDLTAAGVMVIDPRGEQYTPDNVGERLSVRNFMQDLRAGGEITGGPRPFGNREKRAFADALDRALTRLLKARPPAAGGNEEANRSSPL